MGQGSGPIAGEVLTAMVRQAADAVADTEAAAIADEPDGVHQHRVRVRRLRSILAGLRPQLDEVAAQRLRVEYGAWGGQLGLVRDIEVLADVADGALDALGSDDPDARRRLVDDRRDEYRRDHARLVELAATPRAAERSRLLAEFAQRPPLVDPEAPARDVLAATLRHEARRVRRAAQGVDGSIGSYHLVRKAGRRMRYVAEAVRDAAPGLFGDEVDALAEAGDDIHGSLGDHRDALVFARTLEQARALAGRAGESVLVYDALLADAHERAGGKLESLEPALAAVRHAAKRLP
ncbi:CHAD domain-containing protein [Microbacter sp. GSS18]|nr:CHAD domain-containing protein [Microbacter sp. GSS18]